MKTLKTQKEVMELFEKWWNNEGSGMPPKPGEDAEIHVKRISAIAWSNGACCVGGGGMSELEQIEAGIKSAVNQITELKSCPFCGSKADLEDHRLMWAVRCTSCTACVLGERAPEPGEEDDLPDSYWESFRQSAISRWNQRSVQP